MDLQTTRAIAIQIAQRAGDTLMQFYDKPHQEATKSNRFDLVTEGDKASEKVILQGLREHFPEHHIFSEESGAMGAPANRAECFWYVDPVDGTTNYASNLPFFSVSIAMADRQMRPLVGVVYNPVYKEMYSAARGFGATMNGKTLQVTSTPVLERAVLISGFPYDRQTNPNNNLREWAEFLMRSRDLRRFGSSALDLCFVASGRADGYWENSLHAWDALAGILCVSEAGGQVSDYSGGTNHLYAGGEIEVVASNGRLHHQMLSVLGGH
jgi:myo-inositol-1(or 4)-monophosphatase